MGIGLYVSRHIAELHGGHIALEFPDDGGTRVTVQLPAQRSAAAPETGISNHYDTDSRVYTAEC
jgi:K+-sensing histidine kinase KdpD